MNTIESKMLSLPSTSLCSCSFVGESGEHARRQLVDMRRICQDTTNDLGKKFAYLDVAPGILADGNRPDTAGEEFDLSRSFATVRHNHEM